MRAAAGLSALLCLCGAASAQDWWKPYSPPCTERENVFAFTQKPAVKLVGKDKYEITFAVKGYCDVTVGIIDAKGKVVRHLGSGVLGANAPAPFQKGSPKQTLLWDGKDDLDVYADRPETLRVKVSLGLKPTFDKILGWSPYDPGGRYLAIAADAHGVLALVDGNHYPRPQLRRYDRDGNYVKTVFPPAADLPLDEMKGMEALEYEPGKKTIHSLTGAEFQHRLRLRSLLPAGGRARPATSLHRERLVHLRQHRQSGLPGLAASDARGGRRVGRCGLRLAPAHARHFTGLLLR